MNRRDFMKIMGGGAACLTMPLKFASAHDYSKNWSRFDARAKYAQFLYVDRGDLDSKSGRNACYSKIIESARSVLPPGTRFNVSATNIESPSYGDLISIKWCYSPSSTTGNMVA